MVVRVCVGWMSLCVRFADCCCRSTHQISGEPHFIITSGVCFFFLFWFTAVFVFYMHTHFAVTLFFSCTPSSFLFFVVFRRCHQACLAAPCDSSVVGYVVGSLSSRSVCHVRCYSSRGLHRFWVLHSYCGTSFTSSRVVQWLVKIFSFTSFLFLSSDDGARTLPRRRKLSNGALSPGTKGLIAPLRGGETRLHISSSWYTRFSFFFSRSPPSLCR